MSERLSWGTHLTCSRIFDSLQFRNDPASYQQGTYLQNFAPLFHIFSYKIDSNIYVR
jgi:hypothetical protein